MKGQRSPEVFASTKINERGMFESTKINGPRGNIAHKGPAQSKIVAAFLKNSRKQNKKKINLIHANKTDVLALEVLKKPEL